ncbi:hypothetical protein KZZ52_02090 [Dactylosporangium sp. AC04546]|uniref:hypothetical protein n=1 Tax=Dactylosporangium sp. AC04546 TaxID=2862460 RepID=UPI001EDF6C86|nr:hypothetical protein [Dactylosporangium sp. AC04546]WVK84250.1 hypothetical protein KZZ52_02090 [Dactylosporangium sp. AC04546]
MARWWGVVVLGGAATLLFAWLGKVAGVSVSTLVSVGAALAALMWMVVLVTLPWNLYFDARRIVAENAISRQRGIDVPESQDIEADRIARWMLRFAIGGHVVTAAATALFALVSGELVGYYLAGFYLLSTALRPAGAYFAHLRERVTSLRRESTHPRDDVVSLNASVRDLTTTVEALKQELGDVQEHAARLEDGQREQRRSSEQLARRIETTIDGISDHQELLTGMRALIRMIRSEPA